MRLRRARSLVTFFQDDTVIVLNYITQIEFQCNIDAILVLSTCADWQTLRELCGSLSQYSSESLLKEVLALCSLGALLIEGTEAANLDEEYDSTWEFGSAAAIYHFSSRTSRWMTSEETRDFLNRRRDSKPLPPAYTSSDKYGPRFQFPDWDIESNINKVMFLRRSRRDFCDVPIDFRALGDCVYSGLGITALVESPIFGIVPLKITPSGGARNPIEGFVYALRVNDLDPGIYHYSGVEHSLGLVSVNPLPPPSKFLGGQEWADRAAAVIFLVAQFERTMWKYPAPNGYRAALIEAGHIAQNIILGATSAGIASTPTCAFNDVAVREALGLTRLTQSPLHAIVLGFPAKGHSAGEWWMERLDQSQM